MIYNTDPDGNSEKYTLSKAIKLGIGVDYNVIAERLIIRLNQLHENYNGELGSGSARLLLLLKFDYPKKNIIVNYLQNKNQK